MEFTANGGHPHMGCVEDSAHRIGYVGPTQNIDSGALAYHNRHAAGEHTIGVV